MKAATAGERSVGWSGAPEQQDPGLVKLTGTVSNLGRLIHTATPGRTSVEFTFDGRKALLDISAGSQPNPLNSDLLTGFRCPGRSS